MAVELENVDAPANPHSEFYLKNAIAVSATITNYSQDLSKSNSGQVRVYSIVSLTAEEFTRYDNDPKTPNGAGRYGIDAQSILLTGLISSTYTNEWTRP